MRCFCWAISLAVVAGCASPPAPSIATQPAAIEAPVAVGEPTAVAHGLGAEQVIQPQSIDPIDPIVNQSPWELARQAEQSTPDIAILLRLQTIDLFLERQEFSAAETQVSYLLDAPLSVKQQLRLTLQRGYIAYGKGDNLLAIEFLQPLKSNPAIAPESRISSLWALANAQLNVARKTDAIVSLLLRDQLVSPDQQRDNQQLLLQICGSLTEIEQSTLRQTAMNNRLPSNLVNGWIFFSDIAKLDQITQQQQLLVWTTNFPNHPAVPQLLGGIAQIALDNYSQIALLLPLTSPFGNEARAFYDGFIAAQSEDSSAYRAAIRLHDIGEGVAQTAVYYQSAINQGADFVVGPLGRNAVGRLLERASLELPTLVLGDIDATQARANLYGISLSPEFEAIQVAQRAFDDGHRQAVVIASEAAGGVRTADAFTKAWLALGGSIVASNSFADAIADYSHIVQQILEVNQSVAREKVLVAQLGIDLHFTPRRRQDADLLLLAVNAKQARLLVPQFRFFQAHDLPMYATSSIFSGAINPAADADLDELVFGDMRWMLNVQYSASPALKPVAVDLPTAGEAIDSTATLTAESVFAPKPIAKSRYSFSQLDRLYALGYESYHLIPRLALLRQPGRQRYQGPAFDASIGKHGNIVRYLQWATFDNGNIKLIGRPPIQPGDN